MRIGSYNVENLFQRAKALNLKTWADGEPVLADFQRLNHLIQAPIYTPAIQDELMAILGRHKGLLSRGESRFLRLREYRGHLLSKPRNQPVGIGAGGRADWVGWFELEREPVNDAAIENTARIIGALDVDVLCVIEAEDRPGLVRFNDDVLPLVKAPPFAHVMLIDGRDERGIDVGIMARAGHDIVGMRSHVDDSDAEGAIFSRDCPEYTVRTPSGAEVLILINHFKSKMGGGEAKRHRQASRVRAIYNERRAQGVANIAILGDFNETPDAWPMEPLLSQGSDLTDIMAHPKFQGDGRPGTWGNGAPSGKFDYILMSPGLEAALVAGGINRSGVWGGTKGTLFPHLDTITSAKEAASDHAALWAEFHL